MLFIVFSLSLVLINVYVEIRSLSAIFLRYVSHCLLFLSAASTVRQEAYTQEVYFQQVIVLDITNTISEFVLLTNILKFRWNSRTDIVNVEKSSLTSNTLSLQIL